MIFQEKPQAAKTETSEAKSPAVETQPSAPQFRYSAASLFLDPRLIFWNVLLLLMSPVWLAMKIRRATKKRSTHEFSLSRWTVPSQDTLESTTAQSGKAGPHIIFAAPSFGEVLLVESVCNAMLDEIPDLRITWAVRDPHTVEELRRHKPDQRVAVWPFDSILPVSKWLKSYQPDMLVLVERYSFPNLIVGAHKLGARVALVNGRCKTSADKPKWFTRSHYRWLFDAFNVMCFQSDLYAERVKGIAPQSTEIAVTGNLKLDHVRNDLDPERANMVTRWIQAPDGVPLLCAGSTNNREEEEFVLEAFTRVRNRIPCRLLLAPRKMERIPSVLKLLEERGLSVSRRSCWEPWADVMLLDTIGELAFAYQFCQAAYVGGSLNGMGHNIAEPVEWGIPVSYGPKRGHFEVLQRSCERAGVGFRLSTSEQLAQHWYEVLTDEAFRSDVNQRCFEMLEDQRGAVSRTARALLSAMSLKR